MSAPTSHKQKYVQSHHCLINHTCSHLPWHSPQNGHFSKIIQGRVQPPPRTQPPENPVNARAMCAKNGHTGTVLASGAARRCNLYVLQPPRARAAECTETQECFPRDESLFVWKSFARGAYVEAERRRAALEMETA